MTGEQNPPVCQAPDREDNPRHTNRDHRAEAEPGRAAATVVWPRGAHSGRSPVIVRATSGGATWPSREGSDSSLCDAVAGQRRTRAAMRAKRCAVVSSWRGPPVPDLTSCPDSPTSRRSSLRGAKARDLTVTNRHVKRVGHLAERELAKIEGQRLAFDELAAAPGLHRGQVLFDVVGCPIAVIWDREIATSTWLITGAGRSARASDP